MSATNATVEERFDLITRRLQEVLGGDAIKAILAEGRSPKCYWGLLTTLSSAPHLKQMQEPRQLVDVRRCVMLVQ
jgi:tyrosyl-tRNA synthetase